MRWFILVLSLVTATSARAAAVDDACAQDGANIQKAWNREVSKLNAFYDDLFTALSEDEKASLDRLSARGRTLWNSSYASPDAYFASRRELDETQRQVTDLYVAYLNRRMDIASSVVHRAQAEGYQVTLPVDVDHPGRQVPGYFSIDRILTVDPTGMRHQLAMTVAWPATERDAKVYILSDSGSFDVMSPEDYVTAHLPQRCAAHFWREAMTSAPASAWGREFQADDDLYHSQRRRTLTWINEKRPLAAQVP